MSEAARTGGANVDVSASMTVRFSTDMFPERERIERYCDVFTRQVMRVHAEPLVRHSFRADLTVRALPGLGLVLVRQSAVRIGRTKDLLSDGDDSVVVTAFNTRALQQHPRREASIEPGDGAVCLSSEVGGGTVPADSKGLALTVPRSALGGLVRCHGDWFARPISGRSPPFKLLMRYLENLEDDTVAATPAVQKLAVTHVYDLLALALGATRDAEEVAKGRGFRAAHLHAIKKAISESLDGDLSVDGIAARRGVTPRYIQRLFEDEGTTFTEFVRDKRLDRAHAMLRNRRFDRFRIGDIALEAGFADLSYFHRQFRRRFGLSPTDVRTHAVLADS